MSDHFRCFDILFIVSCSRQLCNCLCLSLCMSICLSVNLSELHVYSVASCLFDRFASYSAQMTMSHTPFEIKNQGYMSRSKFLLCSLLALVNKVCCSYWIPKSTYSWENYELLQDKSVVVIYNCYQYYCFGVASVSDITPLCLMLA